MNNDFLIKIKEQTDELHTKAHHLEYFKIMFKHTLPKESYIGQLRALAIIYGALEREIEQSAVEFPKDYVKKLPLLSNDISFLEEDKKENKEVIKIALQTVDDIMTLSINNPSTLIGYLYTLEGSLQGSNVVAPHIIEQFDIKDNKGVSYFYSYGENLKDYWDKFKIYLKENSINNEDTIIKASNNCFEALIKIYDSLYPYDEDQYKYHSSTLNPEAGNHRISQDPKEIEAAINASKECWFYFPYFELKFGSRGYRFALSDTAWLITLNYMDLDIAQSETQWLAKILSNRGMPSIILEKQLSMLYDKLNDSEKYAQILTLSKFLKQKRELLIDEETFKKLSKEFDSMLDPTEVRKLRNPGELIICSLVDVKLGFEQSFNSITKWFYDEDIFSKDFIEQFDKASKKVKDDMQVILG